MMDAAERDRALALMERSIQRFYQDAVGIGVHPFIEFAGLMTGYAKSCRRAHEGGIDFTECNRHAGQRLPMESFELAYVNEKLECIFSGQVAMAEKAETP